MLCITIPSAYLSYAMEILTFGLFSLQSPDPHPASGNHTSDPLFYEFVFKV